MTTEDMALPDNDRRFRTEVLDPAGQATFTFDFPIDDAADIVVYVDDVEASIASVDVAASEVTIEVAAAQGAIVAIEGLTSLTRKQLYPIRGGLPSSRLNMETNKVFHALQEMRRDIDRMMMIAKSSADVSAVLPTLVADRALMVNSTATGFAMGPTSSEIAGAAEAAAEAIAARDNAVSLRDETAVFHSGTETFRNQASDFASDAAGAQAAAAAAAVSAANSVARLVATSVSAVAIDTGEKAFVTQADKLFAAGAAVMVSSDANPSTHYMTGIITSYVGTDLTVSVLRAGGAGSRSDWTIHVSGLPGMNGTGLTDGNKGQITVDDDGNSFLINSGTALAGAPLQADGEGGAAFAGGALMDLAFKGKATLADIDTAAAAAGLIFASDGGGGAHLITIPEPDGGLWEEIAYEDVTGFGLSQLDMALPDGYDRYKLEVINVYGSGSTALTNMRLLYNGMTSVYTSQYYLSDLTNFSSGTNTYYAFTAATAATCGLSAASGYTSGANGNPGLWNDFELFRGGSAGSGYFDVRGRSRGAGSSGLTSILGPFGWTRSTGATKVDGIRLYTAAGTWASGAFRLIGQKSH